MEKDCKLCPFVSPAIERLNDCQMQQLTENHIVVSFKKGDSRINVYYSKMTVATVVTHPKWGCNQMFRRGVYGKALSEIFKNPRAHLNLIGIPGYHEAGRHIASLNRGKK